MTPEALLTAARQLMRQPRASTAGLWARAAALLARQALEEGLRSLWKYQVPGTERATARCQLVCLGQVLADPRFGDRVHQAWLALSHACHYRSYELAPTADELEGWTETVEALLVRVRTTIPDR